MALRLSQEEFTRGVQTYSRDMYRAARALTPCDADAQDAVGQAVLLAWQSLDRLRDPEALRAWLVKISVNCARQLNRRSRREVYLEDLPPRRQPGRTRGRSCGTRCCPCPGTSGRRWCCITMRTCRWRTLRRCCGCRRAR